MAHEKETAGQDEGANRVREAGKAQGSLYVSGNELERMATSANVLGMTGMADVLRRLASDVFEAAKDLHKCWEDEFFARCAESKQATQNMVGAALAMCDRGKRHV